MEIDFDLIKIIAITGIGASILSTPTIQKIKEMLKNKKYLKLISLIVSFVIGECFTLSFTDLGFINGIWVGLCAWVGASAIYQAFEDKLFTPFKEINDNNHVVIDRDDENV